MKRAVVTLCIGDAFNDFAQYSHPTMKRYAEKVQADFVPITEAKICFEKSRHFNPLLFEKYQLCDLLDDYDRILFLDTDILVTPHAPNVFDIVPEDKIGAVYEDFGSTTTHRRGLIRQVQGYLGELDWYTGFFNSGVMVVSQAHQEGFRCYEQYGFMDGEYEQTNTNWYLRKIGGEIFELDYKFNFTGLMRVYYGPIHRDAYFIHYAGGGIVTDVPRIDQIRADYCYFYDKNNYTPETDPLAEL